MKESKRRLLYYTNSTLISSSVRFTLWPSLIRLVFRVHQSRKVHFSVTFFSPLQMPSEPRVPLPMSSFSRRSSNVTLSVSPTLSQSSVANALGSQIHLQRPKKLSLEASSTAGSRRHSSSYSSVRRWHSVRCSGTRTQSFASLNGANYSPSLRSRRVSSSAVLEKGLEGELGSYDKYKISRANPDSLINLVIEDSISPGESK